MFALCIRDETVVSSVPLELNGDHSSIEEENYDVCAWKNETKAIIFEYDGARTIVYVGSHFFV